MDKRLHLPLPQDRRPELNKNYEDVTLSPITAKVDIIKFSRKYKNSFEK